MNLPPLGCRFDSFEHLELAPNILSARMPWKCMRSFAEVGANRQLVNVFSFQSQSETDALKSLAGLNSTECHTTSY